MKLGLIITTFNRPDYLRQCLASVKAADLSQVSTVLIYDDASTDPETRRLIDEFELPGVELIKAFSKENRSIKGSLLFGLDILFNTCDVVTNLDGDAIVRRDFVKVLLDLHERFPDYIKTGFNCLTRNRNGSERHRVLSEGDGYNCKASVGGVNMMFNKDRYFEWVRPALEICIKQSGNWDHKSCLNSAADNHNIICAVPSVVQHIGISSSMNHSAGGEPPDVATDFVYEETTDYGTRPKLGCEVTEWKVENKYEVEPGTHKLRKLQLYNVTLVGADCVDLDRLLKAADKCEEHIQFGDSMMFSSLVPEVGLPKDRRVIPINKINTKEDYSWFVMKEMLKQCIPEIHTSHILIIQHDGYILNPSAWKDEWLEWDYIGAPWEWYPDNRVGNGGFSLRSKKLMDAVANDPKLIPTSDGVNTYKEEDHCLCRIYRKYLEDNYGIKFAPLEVARQFSIEGWRSKNKTWTNEFGFHGNGLTNVKP